MAAKRLGFVYVDTGAMYRAAALYAMERGIAVVCEKPLTRTLDAAGGALDRDESAQDDGRWHAYREYRNRLFGGGFADTPLHELTDRLTPPEDDTHTDTHSR